MPSRPTVREKGANPTGPKKEAADIIWRPRSVGGIGGWIRIRPPDKRRNRRCQKKDDCDH